MDLEPRSQGFSNEEELKIAELTQAFLDSSDEIDKSERMRIREGIELDLIAEGWDYQRAALMAKEARKRWAMSVAVFSSMEGND
jgi:hypothetical protein